MRRVALDRIIVGCLTIVVGGAAMAGPQLIGVDTVTDTLIRIDTNTGAGTAIGPVGDDVVAGLAYDTNHGILYGSSTRNDVLLRINPATGSTTVIGPLGTTVMHGIAYDSADDTLYGVTGFTGTLALYTINVTTGHATLVGTHEIDGIADLAFDSMNSIMYASDSIQRSLYSLNLATGAATLVGSFGVSPSRIGEGLTYDSALGLFSSDNKGDALPNDQLYHIDTTTGQATLVGDIGYGNVISLAFVPESAIPEPSTALLLLTSLGALRPRRR